MENKLLDAKQVLIKFLRSRSPYRTGETARFKRNDALRFTQGGYAVEVGEFDPETGEYTPYDLSGVVLDDGKEVVLKETTSRVVKDTKVEVEEDETEEDETEEDETDPLEEAATEAEDELDDDFESDDDDGERSKEPERPKKAKTAKKGSRRRKKLSE